MPIVEQLVPMTDVQALKLVPKASQLRSMPVRGELCRNAAPEAVADLFG